MTTMRPHTACVVALLPVFLALGCKTEPAPRTPAEAAAERSTGLRDGQILSIVLASHQTEISESQFALAHTSNDAIRDFASQMLATHTDEQKKAGELGERRHIGLEASTVSERLLEESRQQVLSMSHASGESLDRMYIQDEIQSHQEMIRILDDVLIRGATDDELQTLLGDMRSTTSSHLSQAEELAHRIGQ